MPNKSGFGFNLNVSFSFPRAAKGGTSSTFLTREHPRTQQPPEKVGKMREMRGWCFSIEATKTDNQKQGNAGKFQAKVHMGLGVICFVGFGWG